MKKFFVVTLIMMVALSAASLAAPAPAKKVVTTTTVVQTTTAPVASSSGPKMAVGCALNYPALKFQISEQMIGTIGAMYGSGGGATSTALLLKGDYLLAKVGAAQTAVGLYYGTNGAAAATTSFGVTWGVSAMVADNLSIGVDLIVFNSLSFGGASCTGIGGFGMPGALANGFINVSYYL